MFVGDCCGAGAKNNTDKTRKLLSVLRHILTLLVRYEKSQTKTGRNCDAPD